jgi:predicted ester cyclase
MNKIDLESIYRDYIACLNAQNWNELGRFVRNDVQHNGRLLGLAGYRSMLENDYTQIPDLYFDIQFLIADPPRIASRLQFNVTPKTGFLGLPIDGQRVNFCENVFYEFRDGRIHEVWSVIDKAAIEAQLR